MEKSEFEARLLACSVRYYRVARSILQSDVDCEDAMQEAMIRAWSNLHKLKDTQYFDTWMCRILINECKSHIRQNRRPTVSLNETIPQPEPPDPVLCSL